MGTRRHSVQGAEEQRAAESCGIEIDNSSSRHHQKEKSLKKAVGRGIKKETMMTTTTTKNEEKGCWVGEQLKLCLCSDLVPVNPPTLHDEHYLHTVFIEPFGVCLCV